MSHLKILQTTPRIARQIGWHANPGARPPRQGKGSATVQPIRELADIRRIKAVLAESARDLSLFVVGIHVGLRASDLLAIRWCDVCDEKGDVRRRLVLTEAKTGNSRQIALSEKPRQALVNWRKQEPPDNEACLVWPSLNGRRLSVQRLHQLINSWCIRAEVAGHFGTHSLRKTYGYHLRRNGTDIEVLMKIFGHSSAAITLRYVGIHQDEIDEANLKLSL